MFDFEGQGAVEKERERERKSYVMTQDRFARSVFKRRTLDWRRNVVVPNNRLKFVALDVVLILSPWTNNWLHFRQIYLVASRLWQLVSCSSRPLAL